MFSLEDLQQMNDAVKELEHIVKQNNADADYAIEHKEKLEFVYELRENAIEAQKILDRYIRLIDNLKADALKSFKSLS